MNRLVTGFLILCSLALPALAQDAVKIQLNWKPEPQFGGFYAIAEKGFDGQNGLVVEVSPGGAGTPTVQMVGAGRVDFAVVSGDELVVARHRGNDVVALFAVYQTNPQGLMTRADRGFKSIGDVFANPGTVAMQKGLPYSNFLQKKYGFDKVQIVPSPFGDLSQYRTNPTYTMQCFVTSEPIAADKTGIKAQTFLIAESGYNPYTTVVVTRGEVLRKNPDLVKRVTRAIEQGWGAYLADPSSTNALMHKLNPTMDMETFASSAAAQRGLIVSDEESARNIPPGVMMEERWQTLIDQLVDLKVIDKPISAKDCFVRYEGDIKPSTTHDVNR